MKQEIKVRVEKIRMREVPEGYRMTKVGVIPEGWEMKKLGDAAEVVMGQSPVGTSYNHNGIGAPLINGPTEFTKKYPIKIQWTSQPTKFCKKGDMLLCVRGSSTGRMNISDDEYCIGRGVAAIRAKSDADMLFITFQVESAVKSILALTTGSTFPNIDGKSIKTIQFPIPPLFEQQQIAEIISTWDKAIELKEKLIEEKKEFKRGLIQKLLTGEMRFPEFTDEWEETRLGKKLTFIKKETVENPQNYKLLKVKLHLKGIEATENCPNPTENGRPYHFRSEGELLIGRQNFHNGGIGVIPKGMNGYIASNAISSLEPSDDNLMFYYYYLSSPNFYRKVGHLIGGTGQKEISESMFKNLKMKLPSNDKEIKKISETIKTLYQYLETETNILSQLKEQKRGLMQLLLTGIVRVEID